MGIIKTRDLIYEYIRRDEEGNVEGITRALDAYQCDPLSYGRDGLGRWNGYCQGGAPLGDKAEGRHGLSES